MLFIKLTGLIVFLTIAVPLFVSAVPIDDGGADDQKLPDKCSITDARVAEIRLSDNTTCPDVGTGTADIDTQGICCVFNAIYTVTDWIFFALIAIVILLVVIGGFIIATAGGDAEKVRTGRSYLLFAALGLALALLARAVPGAVRVLVGA